MVVKKTKSSKSVKGSTAKKSVYKVLAVYNARFNNVAGAKAAQAKVRQNPKAAVSPIKKVGNGYGFGVKFAFVTPSATIRNQAVAGAKKTGAKVSVSTVKM